MELTVLLNFIEIEMKATLSLNSFIDREMLLYLNKC